MDREARNPFDLMEQIEQEFGIRTYPVNWPIGCGKEFKGVYDRHKREIDSCFSATALQWRASGGESGAVKREDARLGEMIGETHRQTLVISNCSTRKL